MVEQASGRSMPPPANRSSSSARASAVCRGARCAGSPGTVERIVLLAPALDFCMVGSRRWRSRPEGMGSVRELNVFHYGYGRIVPLHYALYTDACAYDAATSVSISRSSFFRDSAIRRSIPSRGTVGEGAAERRAAPARRRPSARGSLEYICRKRNGSCGSSA